MNHTHTHNTHTHTHTHAHNTYIHTYTHAPYLSPLSPTGERRRKSVRGCIVSSDLSVLNLVIVKKGEQDLPGLTDEEKPRMRGPKRASKIRKLFNLSKVGVAMSAHPGVGVGGWVNVGVCVCV